MTRWQRGEAEIARLLAGGELQLLAGGAAEGAQWLKKARGTRSRLLKCGRLGSAAGSSVSSPTGMRTYSGATARCADSASPYRSPRSCRSSVEPSMSLNNMVIVPVGSSPCPDCRPTITPGHDGSQACITDS
jgi:hypothetical protein